MDANNVMNFKIKNSRPYQGKERKEFYLI